ncbi:MAG: hypothetical protein LUC36_05855 [Oscillospiraceae bacterium]|nr:hypothetical protein [Oscillospiraceae bacterium]
MTLLITVFAAVISTAVWYRTAPKGTMMVGVLCWLYWGASLMWLVDAVAEYVELGAALFTPEPSDMLNDAFLGLSAVELGLVIWSRKNAAADFADCQGAARSRRKACADNAARRGER